MKHFTAIALLSLSSTAFSQHFTKDISQFDELIVSRGIEVSLEKSTSSTLVFDAHGLALEDLIIENSRGVLRIKVRTKALWEDLTSHHGWVKVTVPYQQLKFIEASMGASIFAHDAIESDDLEIEASMGGIIELSVKATHLSLEASMGSEVQLEGSANEFEVSASMGSNVNSFRLECILVKASASMGSNLSVNCTEKFDGKAGMGGSIEVSGNPGKFYESTSMGGEISSGSN